MARISGVDLPNKPLKIALTYIYGIGKKTSKDICIKLNLDLDRRANTLTNEDISKLRELIEGNYKIEGTLRSEVSFNIKRLMDIVSYRGLRHRKGLPVRGQRTRSNARTRKGKKKTVAGKKR